MGAGKERVYGVLAGTWYLAPGSKNSSPRGSTGATPWYSALSCHHAVLYSDGSIEPSNTPQRQRSIISPNGRNATFASAMRICELIRASRSEEHTSELQSLMRISYAV